MAFLQSGPFQNLHAQAHARYILRHLAQPSGDWPNFRADLDDRLHHSAHFLLWTALQLMEAGQAQQDVTPLLLAGSEAMEFLCVDPQYDSAVRVEQAINSTFGYYLSGYYARSFVLLREAVPDSTALPPALALLVAVLRKQFGQARAITIANFRQANFTDDAISQDLSAGRIGQDEAYNRLLLFSATQAVSFFLEFPKNGQRALLDTAIEILDDAILIARERRYVDWWWWLFCLRFLFREYGDASPWTRLTPFRGGDPRDSLIDDYIRAGLRHHPPVIELWPSQVQALPTIADAARPDFCLKMPTSSGKTRIAELTILRFLHDHAADPTTKCIYLAPFRSLAVEVEQTLRRSIGRLGVDVSQIYGGFEITPADVVFLNQYRVLIATPEKFDALLRFVPELADQIRLVIVDEGHIVDPNLRGLRFEFFVHRLLRRLPRSQCRFVFISAVLPNAKQFAEWITGSPDQLVESQWRPSRLMLGRLNWDGSRVRIEYTHQGRQPFGQDCFVPRFIEQRNCRGIQGLGRRRNPFPHDADEAFALSALLCAQEGVTLVFVPQQRMAEPTALRLLEALRVYRCIREHEGESFALPTPGRGAAAWERCRSVIETEMGSDSNLLTLLNEGILLHHGGLPWRVRVAIEDLARADAVRLIVATTTLAQGINLPIKTVFVRSLQFGHNQDVRAMTFWNICGRAGRAMKENEGQILFWIDRTVPRTQQRRLERSINVVVDTLEQASVTSVMLLVLRNMSKEWNRTHPAVSLSELCLYLAENRLDWVSDDQKNQYRVILDVLDGHLLALSEEFDLGPASRDRLQELLQGSLLFIQLRDTKDTVITADVARDIFHARIRYIHGAHPDKTVRLRLYKLGLALSSCETIEAERADLLALFCEAEAWFQWSLEQKADLLLRISQFIFRLQDIAPDEPLPREWPAIFSAWLAGATTAEMSKNDAIKGFTDSPSTLCRFVEDTCGYLLPWGLNSILTYLSVVAAEVHQDVPAICSYFSGMTKYGVSDAVAVCIVPYLDQDRSLAMKAAAVCPHSFEHPDDVIRWILSVTVQDLVDLGVEHAIADAIFQRREWQRHPSDGEPRGQAEELVLPIDPKNARVVSIGDRVLLVPEDASPGVFEAFTLGGSSIGRFQHHEHLLPEWWNDIHLVDAEIRSMQQNDDGKWSAEVSIRAI